MLRSLVVRQPWATLMVTGSKPWEIRGSATRVRGPGAIAAGRTGTIVGSPGSSRATIP